VFERRPVVEQKNRRTPRRVFERAVGVLYKGQYKLCRAKQISEGGILLLSDFQLKVNDHVVMTVLLPAGGHAIVRAKVLYTMPAAKGELPSFGLRFLNLPFNIRRLIRNYVAAKTQEEAESDLLAYERNKTA
jgi:hypothetical protein